MVFPMAVYLRLASRLDIPLINALVYELTEVEGKTSGCRSTETGLRELLFTHPPFQGPTVFMFEIDEPTKLPGSRNRVEEAISGTVVRKSIPEVPENPECEAFANHSEGIVVRNEVSSGTPDLDVELELFRSTSNVKYRGNFFSEASVPISSEIGLYPSKTNTETDVEEPVLEVFRTSSDVNLKDRDGGVSESTLEPLSQDDGREAHVAEIVGELAAGYVVEDSACEAFRSPCADGKASRTVVGFVHVHPNYSTYLAKPGLQMESFYIRKPYRRLGLGKMFLKKIACEAVQLGFEKLEWAVLFSNDPAIRFYEGMGAKVKPGFRRCAIEGEALLACKP